MTISIVDVVQYKYFGQFESGNVGFVYDESVPNGIAIQFWNVPNVTEPTVQELVDLFPTYQAQYDNTQIFNQCNILIVALLDATANQKQYDSALSCASYATSNNVIWKAQAQAFVDWRDSVFDYAYKIMDEVNAGKIPCPTVDEFMAGLPAIVWPI